MLTTASTTSLTSGNSIWRGARRCTVMGNDDALPEQRRDTTFEGETARDAVIALRATSRTPGRDIAHFMAAAAAGTRLQTGRSIRTTTPEVFLADLERVGLIERID